MDRVNEELKRIPGGGCGPFQRMLRLEYRRIRLRHLSADPSAAPDAALSEAISRVRCLFPSATVVYDETFFDVWSAVVPRGSRTLAGSSRTGGSRAPAALLPTGNVIELN